MIALLLHVVFIGSQFGTQKSQAEIDWAGDTAPQVLLSVYEVTELSEALQTVWGVHCGVHA